MLFYKKYVNSKSKDWVIFIHGIGGSSTIFAKQIKDIRKHFNLLLIDLRGHGKTGVIKTNKPYSFDLITKDILEVMDFLYIKKAHFIGVSLGTLIIRNMLYSSPERIERCVLAGAITTYNKRIKFFIKIGIFIKNIFPYMWLYAFFAWVLMPKKTHRLSRVLFIREAKKMNQKEFLRWFDLVYQIEKIHYNLKKQPTETPVLYLMGEEDHMFFETVKIDTKKEENAIFRVIKNSGHVCNVDQPEEFNKQVLLFLQ